MKPSINHRDLVLFKGTSFGRRQFNDQQTAFLSPDAKTFCRELIRSDQTEFLNEFFQASSKESIAIEKLFIWQIDKSSSFIHLSIGNAPLCAEKGASVDPYFFWSTLNMN